MGTIGDRLGAPAPNLDEDTNPNKRTNERTNERTTMFSKTKTAAIAWAALAFTAGCADASSSRGRLLQQVQPVQSVTALDTVEGLIPQRIKIDPYIDFMPLAELEAEAPAFENAPYPRTGVNFAAGPQGDAAPNSQVNEVDETPVVQDDATDAIDNATDLYSWNATDAANTGTDLLNDAIPTGIQGAPLNSTANGTIVNDAGDVANLTISSTED